MHSAVLRKQANKYLRRNINHGKGGDRKGLLLLEGKEGHPKDVILALRPTESEEANHVTIRAFETGKSQEQRRKLGAFMRLQKG